MQTNPVKAIREKCLDCCCGEQQGSQPARWRIAACTRSDMEKTRTGQSGRSAKHRGRRFWPTRKKTVDNNGDITA